MHFNIKHMYKTSSDINDSKPSNLNVIK